MPEEQQHASVTVNVNVIDSVVRWAKFAGVIIAMFIGFAKGYYMLQSEIALTNANAYKINRVEHYLSSHDPTYWQTPADARILVDPTMYGKSAGVHTFGAKVLDPNAPADSSAVKP